MRRRWILLLLAGLSTLTMAQVSTDVFVAAAATGSGAAPATPGTGATTEFVSRPDLRPPGIKILTAKTGVAPGLLFAAPLDVTPDQPQPWSAGLMIYDNSGHLVWFKAGKNLTSLQPITYQGKPALVYEVVTKNFSGHNYGYWVILNQAYHQIATVHAGHGLAADLHEFQLTGHGTVLLDSYRPVTQDLRAYGGSAHATVWDGVIQEVDLSTGAVRFEWHSLGHVPLTDSYVSLKGDNVDYFHINSVDEDSDGNFIASARNTSTVYKINRNTGAVIWRLGGKKSSFRFPSGGGPSYQHDARALGNNTYSVFDNGNSRKISRAVIWRLGGGAATVVDAWHHQPNVFTTIMGSTRALPNGNRLIGWAVTGLTTEYKGHTVVFESKLLEGAASYRMFRAPWTGTPTELPSLAVSRSGNRVTAYASWNGATGIVGWQLLAGPDAQHLRVVDTAGSAGFETVQTSTVGSTDHAFAVRATRVHAPDGTRTEGLMSKVATD